MGFGNMFRSKRARRRAAYAVLVREALHGIHTVVERDAQIDSIGILLSLSERDELWIDIVLAMVDTLRDDHPMSSVLICFLLDTFALPTVETLDELNQKLIKRAKRGPLVPAQARNIAVVWSVYAEKLAGLHSIRIFTEPCFRALMRMMQADHLPSVQLHALLALEKFALTAENKEHILQHPEFLATLRAMEAAEDRRDPARHQVRFAARWSLDNLFPSPNRDFGLDPRRMISINVMLNKSDQTDFLKLARHGLEARNDEDTFESVRGTTAVTSGAWFYEVMVYTAGILQIGWATKHCLFESEDGGGVGDDANSIAFDGCRRRIWHRGMSVEYGSRSWRPGDVIGVFLDMDHNTLTYTLNGEELGNAMALLDPPVNFHNLVAADMGLYPAISMIVHQHCAVNFGDRPFRFSPRGMFQTLNSVGTLSTEQRIILPRLAQRVQDLRLTPGVQEDTIVRCQICCDRPQGCMLLPCRHTGFCTTCAIQCEICPICREPIEERTEQPVALPPPPNVPAPESLRGAHDGGIPINPDSMRNSSAGRRSNNSASTRSLWLGTVNFRPTVLAAGSRSPSPGNTLQRSDPADQGAFPSPVPSVSSRGRPSPVTTLNTRSELAAAGRAGSGSVTPAQLQPSSSSPSLRETAPPWSRTPPGSLAQSSGGGAGASPPKG